MTLRTLTLLAATAMMAVLLLAGCDVFTRYVQHEVQDKIQDQNSRVSEDAIVIQGPAVLPSQGGDTTYPVDLIPESHIYVIEQDGTNEARSIHAAENEEGAVLSPDGEKIAFLSGEFDQDLDTGSIDVYVMDVDGTDRTKITTSTSVQDDLRTDRGQPVWSPDSERVAFTSYTVANPIPDSSEDSGNEPVEEVNGIYVANASGLGDPSMISSSSGVGSPINLTWSPDGEKIAFYNGGIEVIKDDDNGQWDRIGPTTFIDLTAQPTYSWSPDGRRIAFVDYYYSDLYVRKADGRGERRLTNTPEPEGYPAWSPDGKRIAFVGQYDLDLNVINADGSGRKRLANTISYYSSSDSSSVVPSNAFPAWSPDSKKIAFFCPAPPGSKGRDLCMINADGTEWQRLALEVD
jgi:TolB protein